MAKLTDAQLAEALSQFTTSGHFHPLKGKRWQWKGEVSGATIAFVVANQSKDYPNFLANDRDFAAVHLAEQTNKYDHCCVVLAKVSANGTLTYHSHISVAEARERLKHVRIFNGEYSSFWLLPPNFADASFVTVEDEAF
jgi:hypothetical protein